MQDTEAQIQLTSDDLIEVIQAINPEAAEFLRNPSILQAGDDSWTPSMYLSSVLSNAFDWSDSPQGEMYWRDIYNKLSEIERQL